MGIRHFCTVNVWVVLITATHVFAEVNPADIKRGEYLFKGACGAYCHSTTTELRDAPYLFDCEWLHGGKDDEIFRIIFDGVSDTRMPAFSNKLPNGEDDIWKIIAFLKSKGEACAE